MFYPIFRVLIIEGEIQSFLFDFHINAKADNNAVGFELTFLYRQRNVNNFVFLLKLRLYLFQVLFST